MEKLIRAALVQTKNSAHIPKNKETITSKIAQTIKLENVRHISSLISLAAQQGVQIICLNELFFAPYFPIEKEVTTNWFHFAESIESGPTIKRLQALSKKYSMVIVAPIYEMASQGKPYNTAVVLDSGKLIGIYRKTHIPHGANERGNFTEKFYLQESNDIDMNKKYKNIARGLLPVFPTTLGNIGVAICYDRHFSYVWKTLKQQHAHIVFSPGVTFGNVSKKVWKHEFSTEAVRNTFFIGASNKYGREFPNGPHFFGKSYFVGPDGSSLKNISSHKELIIANLDLSQIDQDQSGWDLNNNKRKDLEKFAL